MIRLVRGSLVIYILSITVLDDCKVSNVLVFRARPLFSLKVNVNSLYWTLYWIGSQYELCIITNAGIIICYPARLFNCIMLTINARMVYSLLWHVTLVGPNLCHYEVTFLILLDMSAAFDIVSHDIILERLSVHRGITDKAFHWISSYLCSRRQAVDINGTLSGELTLDGGIPQGSVSGPRYYIIYTFPLWDILRKHGTQYHFYVDYNEDYLSFKGNDVQKNITRILECHKAYVFIPPRLHGCKITTLRASSSHYLPSSRCSEFCWLVSYWCKMMGTYYPCIKGLTLCTLVAHHRTSGISNTSIGKNIRK